MKTIYTNQIQDLQSFINNENWYWGSDYSCGDLYEAEECYYDKGSVKPNRLIFVHYPDGTIYEPVILTENQYFGPAVYEDNNIYFLLADFNKKEIAIKCFDKESKEVSNYHTEKLVNQDDCCNLVISSSPICLVREKEACEFEMVWPEKYHFGIEMTETFDFMENDRLFFSKWIEDPDYHEYVVTRKPYTGEIESVEEGSIKKMPNGERWIVK